MLSYYILKIVCIHYLYDVLRGYIYAYHGISIAPVSILNEKKIFFNSKSYFTTILTNDISSFQTFPVKYTYFKEKKSIYLSIREMQNKSRLECVI